MALAQCSVSFREYSIVSVIFRLCSRCIPRILGMNLDRTINFKAPAKMATIGKELCVIFPRDLKRWYEKAVTFRYVCSLCYQFLGSCRFLWYKRKKGRDLH